MRRRSRRVALAALLAVVALAAFAVPTLWGRPWSIDHFYLRTFARFALERPQFLSQLRILEPWGLDWFAGDLDDQSVAFSLATARRAAADLETLRSYDVADLSPTQQLSRDVLERFLALQVEGERFLLHDYPVNQMSGV